MFIGTQFCDLLENATRLRLQPLSKDNDFCSLCSGDTFDYERLTLPDMPTDPAGLDLLHEDSRSSAAALQRAIAIAAAPDLLRDVSSRLPALSSCMHVPHTKTAKTEPCFTTRHCAARQPTAYLLPIAACRKRSAVLHVESQHHSHSAPCSNFEKVSRV